MLEAFAANTDACPERLRTLDPSATNGQACTAFLIRRRERPADAGADFKDVVPDVASPGRLASCDRCSENRLYPRTNGASCVGIASSTGQRFEVASCASDVGVESVGGELGARESGQLDLAHRDHA